MYKKISITVIGVILVGLFFLQNTFALSTYVGIEIQELKDDPAHSCAGVGTFGDQGRIRGFVSNPDDGYPIHYKLYRVSDSTVVWENDSTANTDYQKGDIMYLPQMVDLTPGEEYGLFFDVDAYKIHLPLRDYGGFRATLNDTYWVSGRYARNAPKNEYYQRANSNACTYERGSYTSFYDSSCPIYGFAISNNRSNLNSGCWTDATEYNCDDEGITFAYVGWGGYGCPNLYDYSFKMYTTYLDLYKDTKGNFEFTFIFN